MKRYIRTIIFTLSAVVALAAWIYSIAVYPAGTIRDIPLEEFYAFVGLFLLYAALLATPLYAAAPNLPGKELYFRARRALGVSGFGFALLHSAIAFFGLLQGFHGIGFLDHRYLVSLFWGLAALIILLALSAVSFDRAVHAMGKWWKRLQRLAYLAGVGSLIHVVIIGSHYTDLSAAIPSVSFILLIILLILESIRLDQYIKEKYLRNTQQFSFLFVVLFALLVLLSYIYVSQAGAGGIGGLSFNIHAQHEKEAALQAEQAAQAQKQ
jgi:sulfoxide reductase heme-binding subunit YedZ